MIIKALKTFSDGIISMHEGEIAKVPDAKAQLYISEGYAVEYTGEAGEIDLSAYAKKTDLEGYLASEDVLSSEVTNVGTYLKKNGTCTITTKENNVVNVAHVTTDNGGAFFRVPITPNEDNILTFHFDNIVGLNETVRAMVFIEALGTFKSAGYLSISGSDPQDVIFYLWAGYISYLELSENANIVLMLKGNFSYDLSVSVASGKDRTMETIIQNNIDVENNKKLAGKKVLFLGDSITSFTKNTRGGASWVDLFTGISGCTNVGNVAVERATLIEYNDTSYDGDPNINNQHSNVLGNQIQKIINGNYETPDIVVIAIGTNGGITADDTRVQQSYVLNDEIVALDNLDKTHAEGAFRYCNETLHSIFPNALIVWCNPIQRAKANHLIYGYGEALRVLTAYAGVNNIETNRCGIIGGHENFNADGECLMDGLHPNNNGALKMALFNINEISKLL